MVEQSEDHPGSARMIVSDHPTESNTLSLSLGTMETHDNPRIGSFDIKEIRPHTSHGSDNTRVVFFTTPYSTPPTIAVGISALDIAGSTSIIHVNTHTNNIHRDRFSVSLNSAEDTKLYSGCSSWLEIEAGDQDFQHGRCAIENCLRGASGTLNTCLITFPHAYQTPPKVMVWLSAISVSGNRNLRLKTYATHVTVIGFTLHMDTWSDSVLHGCHVSWVAYPTGKKKVFSGAYNTTDMRPVGQPQHYNSGYANFDNGIFDRPPRIFMAINSLDMEHGKDIKVALGNSNVSERGILWSINSWGNAVLYSAGASYIALG